MSMNPQQIADWCNATEQKETTDWYFSSLLKTFETIKNARAKVPKDPHDISARWDYPQAIEHLQIFIDAWEGKRNFNDETEKIEDILEQKKLLPNENWLVERSRLRMLGHSEIEIQELLVKNKVVNIMEANSSDSEIKKP